MNPALPASPGSRANSTSPAGPDSRKPLAPSELGFNRRFGFPGDVRGAWLPVPRNLGSTGDHDDSRARADAPTQTVQDLIHAAPVRAVQWAGDRDHRWQSAGLIPIADRADGLADRPAWLANREGAIGTAGESAGCAQEPAAEPRFFRRAPAQGSHLLEFADR